MPKDIEDRAEANSMLDASARQGIRKPIRLVIVDRQPIVLQGLKSILGTQQDFDVVASISDGPSCLEAIRKLSPDVALIADSLPDLTVSEILAIAKAEKLSTRLVFFTDSDGDRDLVAAIAAGACSAISKYAAPAAMLQSLRLMERSGVSLESSDLSPVGKEADGGGKLEKLLELLTPRERQIVRLVAEGMSNKEIARRLDVSQGTVKVHLHNIFQKLEITNRTVLATISWLQRTSGFVALALAFLAFAIADELRAAEANDNFGHDDGPGPADDHAGYEVWKKAILAQLVISASGGTHPFTEKDLLAKASHAASPAAAMEALRAAEQVLGSKFWNEGGATGSGMSDPAAYLLPAISGAQIAGGAVPVHQIPQLASTSMSVPGGYGTFATLAGALIYALSDPHLATHAGELSKASIESFLTGIGDNATTKLAAVSDVDANHAGSAAPDFLSHDLHSAFVIPAVNVTQEGVRGSGAADHNFQTLVGLLDAGHAPGLGGDSRDGTTAGRVDDIVHRSPIGASSAPSDAVVDGASGPGRLNLAAFGALAWLHLTAAAKSIPPHTLAWIYDAASNQTIVYVNPTDHVLDVGDRGLVEVHLQGIVSVAEADVVQQAEGTVHAATLEQLEHALMPAAATDETGPNTNGSHASEDSLGTASIWSASADDGSSFQFAAVRSGSGTSAKSSSYTRDSVDTTEESAGASGVSAYGSSTAPSHGATPPAAENVTAKSGAANANSGAQSTTQNEIVPSGFDTADGTNRDNSDHASDQGQAQGAATGDAESNPGSGGGNDVEHHSQAPDSPPPPARAVEAGSAAHSHSDHPAAGKDVERESDATTGGAQSGPPQHAAEPGPAKPAATETAEAKPKPDGGAGHDDVHHTPAPPSPPAAAQSASGGHDNLPDAVSSREANAGESTATTDNRDHGHPQHPAEPGSAKAAHAEMAEAGSKPGNGMGNDEAHYSRALEDSPQAANTPEPSRAEQSNSGHPSSVLAVDQDGSAATRGTTDHGNAQQAGHSGANASEPARPEKAAFEFGAADQVFRFDGAAPSPPMTLVAPKEFHNPYAALASQDDLRTIVEMVSHAVDDHAAHGNHGPHPGAVAGSHDLLI